MAALRKRPQWTPGKTALVIIGISVALIVTLIVIQVRVNSAVPNIVVPMPKMPSPNAFDFYRKAGYAVLDDAKIGDAIGTRPRLANSYSLADKEALVKENAGPLKTLRQGFAYPYLNPPSRSFYTLFPYYAKFRGLARLLTLEGQTRSERGDWGGAVNSDLDAIQLGETAPRGSGVIGELVGIACQGIGRQPVWKAIDHLNAGQTHRSARRLEQITALHVPFADTLQEEKWGIQAGLVEIFRKAHWQDEFRSMYQTGGQSLPDQAAWNRFRDDLPFMFMNKRVILQNNARYMDQLIANARQPYAARPPAPPIPQDLINQIVLPGFDQAQIQDVNKSQTQNVLLLVALALRAYRLEHGNYPPKLDALVPVYLKRVPDDPFALQGPLRYRRTGQKYVLYSVGPDGKDDGGTPIDNQARGQQNGISASNPNARYFVDAASTGDIVAGVNRW